MDSPVPKASHISSGLISLNVEIASLYVSVYTALTDNFCTLFLWYGGRDSIRCMEEVTRTCNFLQSRTYIFIKCQHLPEDLEVLIMIFL